MAVIEHPPGEESQFDWLELPDPPAQWGWGSKAFLFVGALAHSGRWRGVLAESTDQPHLIDALHRVCVGLGGLTRTWRFDRMATVCHPATGRITSSFAAVARHYGVSVAICPARRGNRKGVVEKANHTAAQRWWRTLPDDAHPSRPRPRWTGVSAARRHPPAPDQRRTGHGGHRRRARTAGPVPAPFPAVLSVERTASAQALVAFRGNRYSVPPELARAQITVSHRLGAPTSTWPPAAGSSSPATPWPRPAPAPPSATPGTSRPWSARRWPRSPTPRRTAASSASHPARPPGPPLSPARHHHCRHIVHIRHHNRHRNRHRRRVVIDLARYAAAAQGRNTLR